MNATRRSFLVASGASLLGVAAAPVAKTETTDVPRLERWIRAHAAEIPSTNPTRSAPIAPLGRAAHHALVVGLGETHGAREQADLKFGAVRTLVEENGFRAIAWEDDWTTGYEIDRYVTTGRGDLSAIVGDMTAQWQSEQTVQLLSWLRRFNADRSDPVRFFGVEYYYTGMLAYTALDEYVADAAPAELGRLRQHLERIMPTTEDKRAYAAIYAALDNKTEYIRHAHEVHRLVREIRTGTGDAAHAVALHHARQIVWFHEHYALTQDQQAVVREACAAENLHWWQRRNGSRVAYWAATPHTASAPDMRIALPGGMEFRFPSSGSYLRRWYGDRYLSVAFTLGEGRVGLGSETHALAPPHPHWFESPMTRQPYDHFVLDLRNAAAPVARAWLDSPIVTRGMPWAGPDSTISGGSADQWFDMVIHSQHVTSQSPAAQPPG